MTDLDKRGIKQGGLSEEDYRGFLPLAMELMNGAHEILGATSTLSESMRQRLGAQLQHEMLPYLLTTQTAERFYSKPRGYAGDYLAIDGIYQNVPGGTGRLGPFMDRMFLDTPPAVAVRNRRVLLANEIVRTVQSKPDGPVNVLCLASGPATEVFDAFAALPDPSRLRVTLMDIDLHALAFVDELRAKRKLASQITLINENLVALFLGRSKTRLDPMDMIYSIGLIDYLNDKLVNKVLHFAHGLLAPGGRVILGNFHPRNPAKEFMDFVMEWCLIHRTEEDMNRLFKDSPFARPCTRISTERRPAPPSPGSAARLRAN
jgi:SAM-dependent methyltransferase